MNPERATKKASTCSVCNMAGCKCGDNCQCPKEGGSFCQEGGGEAGVTGLSAIHNHPDQIRANLQGGRDIKGAHSHLVEKQDVYDRSST